MTDMSSFILVNHKMVCLQISLTFFGNMI